MIKEINTKADKKEFANTGTVFSRLYPGAIPKFFKSELALLDTDKNFFFSSGGIMKSFLAYSENKIVGRIAAFINPDVSNNSQKVGLVGLFDCVNDYSIAEDLLNAAINWLKENSCTEIWGPVDFSIWHSYRFITKGFDTYSFIGEPRNPEYYPAFFEKFGFAKEKTWETYVLDKEDMKSFINQYSAQADLYYI